MSDLTTKAVAAELHVSAETVRNLIAQGSLEAYRVNGAGGPFRVRPEAVDAYRERQRSLDPWARSTPRRSVR